MILEIGQIVKKFITQKIKNMTVLEAKLQKNKNQKSICIKYTDGRVDRVKEGVAYQLIKTEQAFYCSKTEWKQSKNNNEPTQKIEKVKVKKDRIKGAKNIRKANKTK